MTVHPHFQKAVLGLVVAAVITAGCIAARVTRPPAPAPQRDIRVSQLTMLAQPPAGGLIEGTATNQSGHDYVFVALTFNLYDPDNHLLGTTFAVVSSIPAHTSTHFSCGYLTPNVARCELFQTEGAASSLAR